MVELESRVDPSSTVAETDETTVACELAKRVSGIGAGQNASSGQDSARLRRAHVRYPHHGVMCRVPDRLTTVASSGVHEAPRRMTGLVVDGFHRCMDLPDHPAESAPAQELCEDDLREFPVGDPGQ